MVAFWLDNFFLLFNKFKLKLLKGFKTELKNILMIAKTHISLKCRKPQGRLKFCRLLKNLKFFLIHASLCEICG